MESNIKLKSSERERELVEWINRTNSFPLQSISLLPHDASLRRYYRIRMNDNSYIVMDAPPTENIKAFSVIADWLARENLNVPRVYQADFEKGFLRLTDFGDETYLKTLNANNADTLYKAALDSLAKIQRAAPIPYFTLPMFDADFMRKEWQWHQEWFLQKYCRLSLSQKEQENLDKGYHFVIASCVAQPQVFMHRDYHSANLMKTRQSPGILDFQDAFIGPITYDAVSLLRDCYIDWPGEQVYAWLDYYLMNLNLPIKSEDFKRWFDLMGIQRHLKALMTFSRKHLRDSNSNYLIHIPRTLNYIVEVGAKYSELSALHDYYQKVRNLCAR